MNNKFAIALVALALFVLVAIMPVSADYYKVGQVINQGATVFIGEQGLNISPAIASAQGASTTSTTIGWWASAAVVSSTAPTKTIEVGARQNVFTVATADFAGYTGNWYLVENGNAVNGPRIVFSVADPTLDVRVWDNDQSSDVTGGSVTQGENLTFRIDTNMYQAVNNNRMDINASANLSLQTKAIDPSMDGYIDIKVKDETGATLNALYDASGNSNSIVKQFVNNQPFNWNGGWSTKSDHYQSGTYTVWAESLLNNMKENYRNGGADYTGKTISQTYAITLVSDTVKIEANKDTVVRSKPFSVTITGKPNVSYHLWVKGTSTMSGGYDDQPPMIGDNQAGVVKDSPSFVSPLNGGYVFQNSGGLRIIDDVSNGIGTAASSALGNGTNEYANITTGSSGTRTVEFITTNWTKAQKYTIRVEQTFGTQIKSDEVDVNVEKGTVTIVAAGDQSYYLGEEIKFSGTNTESHATYIFVVGPNLPGYGAQIQSLDPRNFPVQNQDVSTFQTADVLGDNTWSWKWGTSNVALDAGTYTIYAVSQPNDKQNLDNAVYGTVSIIIKKPFVSASVSQSTVAQGDSVFITGTAQGNPSQGVAIWILGKNYAKKFSQSVNSDASFSYEVKKEDTDNLYAGQYFVVVQHPMQNNKFDVDISTSDPNYVDNLQLANNQISGITGLHIFKITGSGSLQGSDAAEALVEGINDANVDDTYTKLQFLVEVPVIRVDPIGDKHVGDKFTITATTNLAVDDEVLVEVYSSSFKPTQKSQSGEFSGATSTVKVTKGDSGLNTISFDIDASTFKPDEYLVQENAVLQQATGTALFNVLEGAAPVISTPAPVVVTTAIPPTEAPTVIETTVPTPTPTKSPGYGALIALAGLGAVAFIVVRRQ